MTDTTHTGIALAEEAIRDIARENNCDRKQAACIALREGLGSWGRGYLPEREWPAVLDAAESQLRAVAGTP